MNHNPATASPEEEVVPNQRVSPARSQPDGPRTFHSILFESPEDRERGETSEAPAFAVDLNLDQIIDAITGGRDEYNLKPFFHTPLHDVDAVNYRHEILRDLEDANLFERIKMFAQKMRATRERLAQANNTHSCKYQKEAWFLDAVEVYCGAINGLANDLSLAGLKSRGFLAFREYLANYAGSGPFISLLAEARKLNSDLATVRYCLLIKGDCVKVRKYESEPDYSASVEKTFEKFKQGAAKDYRVEFSNYPEMNHIEEKILNFVAQLHPEIFSNLDNYCANHANFVDETVAIFDREIQFYLAWLEYAERFKRAGLMFCYPQVSDRCKEVRNYEGFDLALAHKLIDENASVVCNDFCLKGKERIIVVSGPNQGGKTTFARAFGQLHYLASLGCPVPGREARLFLFDRLFTHFEREETLNNLRGKLQDDLIRVRDILIQATSNSIVIMNEIFTSTTLQDAIFLSRKVMEKIMALDLPCVWVTFIDELASFGEQTASMVSTVAPEDPAQRTFKIIRRHADGLAYAMAIAEKYQLTYDRLKDRMES
jgi:DNA mismatch repair protein MutS